MYLWRKPPENGSNGIQPASAGFIGNPLKEHITRTSSASHKKNNIAYYLGFTVRLFRLLPLELSLWIGRCLGALGYMLMSKKRLVVYANLKTVFKNEKTPAELRRLSRQTFINLVQSFVELMCFPKMSQSGFDHFIELEGKENIDEALRQGKGAIFLAVHSGNWELGSVFNSLTGYPYNVVANDQPKMPQLELLLNECRKLTGAKVIAKGAATKEIIKALNRNEIVGLLLDQGGKEGVPVDFFSKTASMSSGAIRLALKYDCPVCLGWIKRKECGRHVLEFSLPLPMTKTGNIEMDVQVNVQKAVKHFEDLIREHPQEYLWFYKVYKYSKNALIVHLQDKKGAPRDLKELTSELKEQGMKVDEKIIPVEFREGWRERVFPFYAFLSRFFKSFSYEENLKFFLTGDCYASLMSCKADYVVSSLEREGLNRMISQNHQAKSLF